MMLVNLNVYLRWYLCLLYGYHHDVYFYEIIFVIHYVLVNLYQNFIYETTSKEFFINYKVQYGWNYNCKITINIFLLLR